MRGYQAGTSGADWASTCDAGAPKPVAIRKSLFLNPDSIAFYSAIAAREDNPRALFVAGMAAFIAQKDLPTGKKTMKAYLWKVCGDEYDQLHG